MQIKKCMRFVLLTQYSWESDCCNSFLINYFNFFKTIAVLAGTYNLSHPLPSFEYNGSGLVKCAIVSSVKLKPPKSELSVFSLT